MDLSPVVICAQGEAIWPHFIAETLLQNREEHFLCPLLDLADGGRSIKLFLIVGCLLTSQEGKVIGHEGTFQISICRTEHTPQGWCLQMGYCKGHVLGACLSISGLLHG